MNKPISCLFVFSVVYCVGFRRKLKKTRQKQQTQKKHKTNKNTFEQKQQNKNTGLPAHHSAANEYLSGSGWMSCICCFSRRFSFCFLVCFYYSCFAYACNNSKDKARTNITKEQQNTFDKNKNKNNKHTGHPPAHHSTANKYLAGSGWMSCISFVSFRRFLFSYLLFCC